MSSRACCRGGWRRAMRRLGRFGFPLLIFLLVLLPLVAPGANIVGRVVGPPVRMDDRPAGRRSPASASGNAQPGLIADAARLAGKQREARMIRQTLIAAALLGAVARLCAGRRRAAAKRGSRAWRSFLEWRPDGSQRRSTSGPTPAAGIMPGSRPIARGSRPARNIRFEAAPERRFRPLQRDPRRRLALPGRQRHGIGRAARRHRP